MIARMKFIKIAAPVSELDLVIDEYISKYEIQIENTVAEIDKITDLVSHNEVNPYKDTLHRVTELSETISECEITDKIFNNKDEAVNFINEYEKQLMDINKQRDEIAEELNSKKEALDSILPFKNINYDMQALKDFKFISYRFGRITKDYYKKLNDFSNEEMCQVFCECSRDSDFVWGVYFAPSSEIEDVDAIYMAMNFERLDVNVEYQGKINEIFAGLKEEVSKLDERLQTIENQLHESANSNKSKILCAKKLLEDASKSYEIRKQIAFSKTGESEHFILCGWMQEADAIKLKDEIRQDKKVSFMFEDEHEGPLGGPPVKLENPKFLKPFELLIKMYGLPDYKEFDPTWFVALSYTIIFGMMFGDVGQGLCLFVGGMLLYKIKKMDLAAVIGVAGIFSTIFGFMFGSIFGYEDIIEPLWLRPTESMTDLPFIGKLNTVFAYAILLGMILILLMMVFNIVNAARAGELKEVLFDHNGIAGLVFYGAVVVCVMLFMTGNTLPGTIVLVVMFVIPLILMALKEPLLKLLFKHGAEESQGIGMFISQAFFELFEVLLSYFSNTLSFVRIGGFAVSHASMMAVVLMLAGAENGGMGNIFVIILGNLLVSGLEGLIVGIQVMRLEYYEMFSRFYRGGGREFKPYKNL